MTIQTLHRCVPKYLLCAVLVAVSALLLTSCSGEGQAAERNTQSTADSDKMAPSAQADADADSEAPELVPVEVAALGLGQIEALLRFSTNLEAESEVQVFSQAARQVRELRIEEGDPVRRGAVLVRLQDEEQRSRLARADSQLTKAKREYERQSSLWQQELISEQAFNEATYEVEQLELEVADARRELGYTEVRAPISGTVTSRLVNLGDTVTVNQHLFDLVDFNTLVARIFVPEKELSRLRPGLPARVYSTSLGGAPRSGRVERIAPIVDARSGTVKVTVAIAANQDLRPGMYVEVELVTAVHEEALLVPKQAVVWDDDQAYIFRLGEDDVVERLRLQVGLEDSDHIEPLAGSSDLAADQLIVVAGQAGLKTGTKVRRVGLSQ